MRRYTPARFTDVKLTGSFWRERLDTVLAHTVPSQHRQLAAHGILESLKLPKPVPPLSIPPNRHNFTTQIFWDSDIGKWVEVASYALAHKRDPEIEAKIDAIVEDLAEAQLPDGYLNCWYIQRELENRWTNLRDNHELYNVGHLLEGAIAYYQATGRRRFLDIMERYIDHIAETFGDGPGQKRGYPGHPEIELALVKLYHLTGDRRRLDLAAYFVNERGRRPNYFDVEAEARGDTHYWAETHEYSQSHKPVREQDKAVGHAVRAMYLYTAMADLAAELDDKELKAACELLWQDITAKRMYVTAGVGPSAHNEGFTKDYDLPNDTAYAETCASVALILWAQRMLNLHLEGKYADTLELALFNGALTGLSRDGEHYFYDNPLESDGSHRRWRWHPCPCCTMNAARLVASVAGYFYATGEDSLVVHLYGGTKATLKVAGSPVHIAEESNYPWSGAVSLTLSPEGEAEFSLKLRIPGWARGATAKINGEPVDVAAGTVNGYLGIRRLWVKGDRVELDLPMPPERVYANPQVSADFGRVALKRGPLIYCLEQADNPGVAVRQTRLPRGAEVEPLASEDLFGGATLLVAEGKAVDDTGWQDALYRTEPPREHPARLTAIPYFLWNNRGPGEMQVWIAEAG